MGVRSITVEEMRENARQMKDYTFTASTGATVHMDFSVIRAMSEEERRAARAEFDAVAREIIMKYHHKLM